MSVSLDGKVFMHGAQSYQWQYTLRMASTKTLGGKVLQIFGVTMSDMQVELQFASPEEQKEWFTKIKAVMDAQVPQLGQAAPTPVRFVWTEQMIDAMVFIKSVSQDGSDLAMVATNEAFAPKWTLTLFVESDNTGLKRVAEDSAKAAYIRRISAGLGWEQSEWNGPMEAPTGFNTAIESRTLLTYFIRQREIALNRQYQPPTPNPEA